MGKSGGMQNSGNNSDDAIREQTERILASGTFAGSERLIRFLRFTIETKLRGEGGQIKEYLIGREVFDRSDDYDPRMDPIVRVEARRLRTKLDEYYAGPGRDDVLRIQLPKGGYEPVVETNREQTPSPAAARSSPRRWIVAAAAILVTAAIAAFALLHPAPEGTRVAVVPGSWFGWNPDDARPFEETLAERISAGLVDRAGIFVISWPSTLPLRNSHKRLADVAAELHAEQILVVRAQIDGDWTTATLHLVDGVGGRKIWVREYRRQMLDGVTTQTELARVIGDELEAHYRNRK